jgi:hypothetical protein
MMRIPSGFHSEAPDLLRISAGGALCSAGLACALCVACATHVFAQNPSAASRAYFIDCSSVDAGDGSLAHPWNTLAAAEAHAFAPGDRIALKRGTVCKGAFAPQGSGTADHIIRLTAYGVGARPKIVAASTSRQAFLLFNQEYWQVDSLDISGGSTYGVFVTGDKGTLHHLYLKNLYVHDVYGGPLKNKDNGLVVVGPSSINVFFDDVLIDCVDAAHTNQWAGILAGGGSFPYKDMAPRNHNVQIRNSTVHDVYGDGIVLFRDEDSSITGSAAWLTGMQPTQTVGTPNAIWTWTCLRCTVSNNEAYLTDSPGVDGGAYDIDWNDQFNTVAGNFAHDTQGYCIAVFAAGYKTVSSTARENVCIANGLSPRLAVLQGAVYLHTWNGGTIRNLTIENNRVEWDPRVPGAAAIESDADGELQPIIFTGNTIESTSPLIYNIKSSWQTSANTYILDGQPEFSIGGKSRLSLAALQAQGMEANSLVALPTPPRHEDSLRMDASIDLALDPDGRLLSSDTRAQLIVLRDLAGEYGPHRLKIIIHLPAVPADDTLANALHDLNDVYPDSLQLSGDAPTFDATFSGSIIRLLSPEGRVLQTWHGFQNAATLGGTVRKYLGPPDYSHGQAPEVTKGPQ